MGICKDDMQRELKRLGYSSVRLPRSDIRPLMLIGVEGSSRTVIGNVRDVWPHKPSEIKIETGAAADIAVTRTSKMRASVGARLLDPVFRLFQADAPQLKAAYRKAHSLQIEFDEPQHVRCNAVQLGNVLRSQDTGEDNATVDAFLFSANRHLWVITGVLCSQKLVVHTFDENGNEFDTNDVQIQSAVSVSGGLSAERTRQGSIAYQGALPLTFAFTGLEILIEDGEVTVEGVPAGSHLGPADEAEVEPHSLDEEGPVDLTF